MDHTVAKLLSVVALETLEKLAFIFGSPRRDKGSSAAVEPTVAAQVRFSGAFSGTLGLRVSAGILPELAANTLGIDEGGSIGMDHQHDALREVANVICGRLMPLIGGKEAEYSIEQPLILEARAASVAWHPDAPVASVSLDLEEGGCDLVLALAGEMPARLPPEAIELAEQAMDWTTS